MSGTTATAEGSSTGEGDDGEDESTRSEGKKTGGMRERKGGREAEREEGREEQREREGNRGEGN